MLHREVLLSYSGLRSRVMAEGLASMVRDFFPSVTPSMFPKMPGDYLVDELTQALQRTGCVVLCVTPENRRSRWIHFEAGALMRLGQNHVIPFVYDMPLEKLEDPLKWFGGAPASGSGPARLFEGMARIFGLPVPQHSRVEAAWHPVLDSLGTLTRQIKEDLNVGRENEHHNRILDNCQTVQDRANVFRKYVCASILEDVFSATSECANLIVHERAPEHYVRDTVGDDRSPGAIGGASAVKALCGGKSWDSATVARYYKRNYQFAETCCTRLGCEPQPGQFVRRLFVEPTGRSFTRAQWSVMNDHYRLRSQGIAARVLRSERRTGVVGITPIVNALIDQGFGFFAVQSEHMARVFTHLGGEPNGKPFRYAEYKEPLGVRAILGLFDMLDANCEDFDPRSWPEPPS